MTAAMLAGPFSRAFDWSAYIELRSIIRCLEVAGPQNIRKRWQKTVSYSA